VGTGAALAAIAVLTAVGLLSAFGVIGSRWNIARPIPC
jgi:hypothetical protein